MIQDLAMAVAHLSNVTVSSPFPTSLIVTRSYLPGRMIAVAILLFPIGLIALFFKTTETATFTVTQGDAGGSCKISGVMSRDIRAATDRVLGPRKSA
jgi:hypothetical protein